MDNKRNNFTRDVIKKRYEEATDQKILELTTSLSDQGYEISFGHIGKRTTYCLLSKGEEEIVGYTFVKDLKYNNENVGKLKSLQQAIVRKDILQEKETQDKK